MQKTDTFKGFRLKVVTMVLKKFDSASQVVKHRKYVKKTALAPLLARFGLRLTVD